MRGAQMTQPFRHPLDGRVRRLRAMCFRGLEACRRPPRTGSPRHLQTCFWITSASPSTPSPQDPQPLQRWRRSPKVESLFRWSLYPSPTKAALAVVRKLSKRRQRRQRWKVYSFSAPFVKVGTWRAVTGWKAPNVWHKGLALARPAWWIVRHVRDKHAQ